MPPESSTTAPPDHATAGKRQLEENVVYCSSSQRIKMVQAGRGGTFREKLPGNQPGQRRLERQAPLQLRLSESRLLRAKDKQDEILGQKALLGPDAPNVAVEFDAKEVICTEGIGFVEVPLRRVGKMTGCIECEWCIEGEEKSSVAKTVFKAIRAKSGTVRFEEGALFAKVVVEVPRDPTWNVEGMYMLRLLAGTFRVTEGSGLNPTLGENDIMRVYSVNINAFPAGVKKDETSDFKMIWGFIQHNRSEMPRATSYGIAFSCLQPVLGLLNQIALLLLMNQVVRPSDRLLDVSFGDPETVLRSLVLAIFWIYLLEVLAQSALRELKLGGKALNMLRTNIFSTMLQLSDDAQERFDDGEVPKALDTVAQSAIDSVWLNFFSAVNAGCDFIAHAALTSYLASRVESLPRLVLLCTIFCMAAFAAFVFVVRWKETVRLKEIAINADENWSAFVTMGDICHHCIWSYREGWDFANKFARLHGVFNQMNNAANRFYKYTMWIVQLGFGIFVAVVALIAGEQAQDGVIQIGTFSVMVGCINLMGRDLVRLSTIGNDMIMGVANVREVAHILNQDTRRKELCDAQRRKDGKSPVEEVRAWGFHRPDGNDDIELVDVEFQYSSSGSWAVPTANIRLPAGAMTCFVQESISQRWGVSTLFKIIAGEMLPHAGEVRVPARLKVVYLPRRPLLFDGSLGYNLRIDSPQDAAEVWNLCEAMGMSRELLWNPDVDVGKGGDILRHSDKVIVLIARALHAGVDVLLVSSVIDSLGPTKALQVMHILRSYVRRVGLSSLHTPFHLRHQKTVVYTSKFSTLWEEADYTVYSSDANWIPQTEALANDAVQVSWQMQQDLQHAYGEISRLVSEVEAARMARQNAELKLEAMERHLRNVEADFMKQTQVRQQEQADWRLIEEQMRRQISGLMAGPSPNLRMRDYFYPSRPQRISPAAEETRSREVPWNFAAVGPQYPSRGGLDRQRT